MTSSSGGRTTSRTPLPPDYAERVYAGVLGKLIGVYLGRPVEGWTYDRITATFGEIDRYVPDPMGAPLIVTDDDISGTFTFLRALPNNGNDPNITPRQIGNAWLNSIIYRRTIVWFGGLGDSTEHTAYFRLANSIPAPASGSITLNGKNVGAILGIKNGLTGIDNSGYDWRGPIADRLYLPTADGGRAITDAVRETYEIVNIGRSLTDAPPLAPKDGAKFHFSLRGSVQGFMARNPDLTVEHATGRGSEGAGALAIRWQGVRGVGPVLASTATFTPPEAIDMPFYPLLASPTLYPGQEVRARVVADAGNEESVPASIAIRSYGERDAEQMLTGPAEILPPGGEAVLTWTTPNLGGAPNFEVGIAVEPAAAAAGSIDLDWLTWDGPPDLLLTRPETAGTMWRRAWVDGVDRVESRPSAPYRISQDYGTGILSQGTTDWMDYRVSADISIVLAQNGGIAARVGGMRRWYGLLLCDDGEVRLVKNRDELTVLAEHPFPVEPDRTYHLALSTRGTRIEGEIDGTLLVVAVDDDAPLLSGGVALVVTQGTLSCGSVRVQSVGVNR